MKVYQSTNIAIYSQLKQKQKVKKIGRKQKNNVRNDRTNVNRSENENCFDTIYRLFVAFRFMLDCHYLSGKRERNII